MDNDSLAATCLVSICKPGRSKKRLRYEDWKTSCTPKSGPDFFGCFCSKISMLLLPNKCPKCSYWMKEECAECVLNAFSPIPSCSVCSRRVHRLCAISPVSFPFVCLDCANGVPKCVFDGTSPLVTQGYFYFKNKIPLESSLAIGIDSFCKEFCLLISSENKIKVDKMATFFLFVPFKQTTVYVDSGKSLEYVVMDPGDLFLYSVKVSFEHDLVSEADFIHYSVLPSF